jgi:hypothetical protein
MVMNIPAEKNIKPEIIWMIFNMGSMSKEYNGLRKPISIFYAK